MKYDVIIIGAGQAGLKIGYYLKKSNLSFLILDKGKEIGEVWKSRYDSLILFSTRTYSSLPGLIFEGDQNSYPTKDEVATYLCTYAKKYGLPVQLDTTVFKVSKVIDEFKVSTNKGKLEAKKVVIATGPFQIPLVPDFSKKIRQRRISDTFFRIQKQEPVKGWICISGWWREFWFSNCS